MTKVFFIILFIFGCSLATSCYRMPTNDDFCLIPSTNNPDYIRNTNACMPGVPY